MAGVKIFWHWQNLPANSDVVAPLAVETLPDGKEVLVFFNHTRKQLFFEYDGYYGVLAPDEEAR